ncbi:MAG: DNRLRE domain-containing protein [Bacteroidales bacterium]|nr:DNRLRE domain-containing protein [Bacteroidales bacterium]
MKNTFKLLVTLLVFTIILYGCKKNENLISKGDIKFQIILNGDKSNSEYDEASFVLISIKNETGDYVYQSEQLSLYDFNGYLISEPISLICGNYHLSQFIVLNSDLEAIYASPVEGSVYASFVDEPLPIYFEVIQDNVTKLTPEVISVANSNPEDFGYTTFSFNIVETFDFLLGVFVYNELIQNFELTDYHIKVLGNDQVLFSSDMEAVTNQIKLPGEYENYEINITKQGYQTYSQTFSYEELLLYIEDPLEIILQNGEYNVLILQPNGDQGKDAQIWTYDPTGIIDRGTNRTDIVIYEWTKNGAPTTKYGLIEFDLSDIPENSSISSAYLSLFFDPESVDNQHIFGHCQLGGPNEAYLERITSTWEEPVCWNTQPTTTEENRVLIPASSSPTQDYIINVTLLTQDIIDNFDTSYGFMIKMVEAQYYKSLIFASSEHPNANLHPKLVVTYTYDNKLLTGE